MSVKRKILYVILFLIGFAAPFLFIDVFAKGVIKGSANRFLFTPSIITNNYFVGLERSGNPDNERVKFMFAYQSKQGFYGLKAVRVTPEGEPIVFYVATKDGILSMFVDYTMVEHSPRSFVIVEIDNVVCEPYVSNNPASKSKSILKFSLKSGGFENI